MISIITVCHNSSNIMEAYVSSFLAHHNDAQSRDSVEFVFVENSGDKSIRVQADRLRAVGFSVNLKYTENRGFGSGCNEGAQLASGDILAFVNPDIEFRSPITTLEQSFGLEKWGGPLQCHDNKATTVLNLRPEYCNLLTDLAMTRRWLHLVKPLYRYSYPSGSFFVVPRRVFLDLGGFDERFFLYQEEVELSRRLIERLGPPKVWRNITVAHEGGGTQPSKDQMLAHEARSTVLYGQIIGDLDMAYRRLSTLRILGRFMPINAKRAEHLKKAIEEVIG